MRMIFGGHVDKYDYHVVGLNEEFLSSLLLSAGFTNLRRVSEFGFFEDTSSMKFKGTFISLNVSADPRNRAVTLPNGNVVSIPIAMQAAVQLHRAGRLRKASIIYDLILQAEPNNSDALHLKGLVAHQSGKQETASILINRAIELSPNVAMYHNNLGATYLAMNMPHEAIVECEKALALQPDYPDTFYVMGKALLAEERPDEAVSLIERLLQHKPDFIDAYTTLAEILCRQGKADEALARCRKALSAYPDNPALLCNVGIALRALGRVDETIAHYERVVALKPEFAQAHNNLGNALATQGRTEEAITQYQRAVTLDPSYADSNSSLLMALNYIPRYDAATVYLEHLKFARRYEAPLTASIKPHGNDRSFDRRLRVGYVSSDFREHAVACFVEPVLRQHDRDRFQVFCYSNHHTEDEVTRRIQTNIEGWRSIIRLSDEQAAQQIRDDKIDILVDLNGHTGDNRLLIFARKPAPIQVTWVGYPNTTGLSTMDYRITDAYADPIGLTDDYYTEKIIRLPGSFSCFQPPQDCPEVADLPARHNGYVTFGSFNNLAKVTPEVIALWARVLKAIPRSRLVIKYMALNEQARQQAVRRAFFAHGILDEQLSLLGHSSSKRDHLAQYNSIDIGLDPFPYNGSTTTCDALWMGVPIVTLAGKTHVSRVGVSQLTNLGMTELICHAPEEYVATAVRLAADLDHLGALRKQLRARMTASPLVDAQRFTNNLEKAYLAMWKDLVS